MSAEPLTAQDIEWLRRLANDRVSVRHFNTIFLSTRSAQLVLALLDERDAAIRRASESDGLAIRVATERVSALPVHGGWTRADDVPHYVDRAAVLGILGVIADDEDSRRAALRSHQKPSRRLSIRAARDGGTMSTADLSCLGCGLIREPSTWDATSHAYLCVECVGAIRLRHDPALVASLISDRPDRSPTQITEDLADQLRSFADRLERTAASEQPETEDRT